MTVPIALPYVGAALLNRFKCLVCVAAVSGFRQDFYEEVKVFRPVRLRLAIRGFALTTAVALAATACSVGSVGGGGAVFNDFAGPLYFLPGDAGVTVQLTLYNFQSQNLSQWNLLFSNILLITIPPLVMYIFFNRQIVAGMTSGAVKG